MWLRRCTKSHLISPALIVLVCGCASQGELARAPENAAAPEQAEFQADAQPEIMIMYEQATATMAAGDFVDAELRLKEFVLRYPQFPGAFVNLAIIHAMNGDLAAARDAVDAALQLDPDYPEALNQSGMLLRRNGNFLEAEAAYLKAVTVSPDYALAHYNLGVLYELYLQRLDLALEHFETYQSLVGEDKQVVRWISDLKRRVLADRQSANVAE